MAFLMKNKMLRILLFSLIANSLIYISSEHGNHNHKKIKNHEHVHNDIEEKQHNHNSLKQQKLKDSEDNITNLLTRKTNLLLKDYSKRTQGYLAALLVSLVPFPIFFIILIFRLNNKFFLILMTSFSAGSLLGDVIFHNLSEITHNADANENDLKNNSIFDELFKKELFICYGILLTYIFEKLLIANNALSHSHNHDFNDDHNHNKSNSVDSLIEDLSTNDKVIQKNQENNKSKSDNHIEKSKEEVQQLDKLIPIGFLSCFTFNKEIWIAFLSDFFHNITDGVAIASTFKISTNLGISNLIAITFHEIPHEVADFSFLLKNKASILNALLNQLFAASGAFIGVFISNFFL